MSHLRKHRVILAPALSPTGRDRVTRVLLSAMCSQPSPSRCTLRMNCTSSALLQGLATVIQVGKKSQVNGIKGSFRNSYSYHYLHLSVQDIVSRYRRMYSESQRDLITKPRVAVLRYPGVRIAPPSAIPQRGCVTLGTNAV